MRNNYKGLIRASAVAGTLMVFFGMLGCAKKGGNKAVVAPTFEGKSSKIFLSPSIVNVVNGECDRTSGSLQRSSDMVEWLPLTNTCSLTGKFSIEVSANPIVTAYVRSGSKIGTFSTAATVTVTYAQPPTALSMDFVISGRSDPYGTFGGQNAIGQNYTGYPMVNATTSLGVYETDFVYNNSGMH
jgi:hypothetical protein